MDYFPLVGPAGHAHGWDGRESEMATTPRPLMPVPATPAASAALTPMIETTSAAAMVQQIDVQAMHEKVSGILAPLTADPKNSIKSKDIVDFYEDVKHTRARTTRASGVVKYGVAHYEPYSSSPTR